MDALSQAAGLSLLDGLTLRALFGGEQDPGPLLAMLNALITPAPPLVWVRERPQPGPRGPLEEAPLSLEALDDAGQAAAIELRCGAPVAWRGALRDGAAEAGRCVGIYLLEGSQTRDPGDWHHVFGLREARQGRLLTDQVTLHLFELSTFSRRVPSPRTDKERWLRFLRLGLALEAEALEASPRALQEAHRRLEDISKDNHLRLMSALRQRRLRAQEEEEEASLARREEELAAKAAALEARERALKARAQGGGGDALQQGQRAMLIEVLAWRLERPLEADEWLALETHLRTIPLDGARAYTMESSREELEIWLQRLQGEG